MGQNENESKNVIGLNVVNFIAKYVLEKKIYEIKYLFINKLIIDNIVKSRKIIA